jgi:PHD/YefM family antitoxin component YafN of YafNO toxin-antitoxin module
MPPTRVLTIKQLHDDTGAHVRRAGASTRPVPITDRGTEVAVIASRSLLKPHRRKRTLLPDFEALMARKPGNDVLDDLSAVRGDR